MGGTAATAAGMVGAASQRVLRQVRSSVLRLPARRIQPITRRRQLHIAHTRIIRTVGFERLQRDGTLTTAVAPRQPRRKRGVLG